MQTTEQVAMSLTYVIRRKQICKTYVYVFNIYLIYCGGVTYKINKENFIALGYYAASSGNSLAIFGMTYWYYLQGTLEDGTNRFSRNVAKILSLLTA
jgi:hypothetical protein